MASRQVSPPPRCAPCRPRPLPIPVVGRRGRKSETLDSASRGTPYHSFEQCRQCTKTRRSLRRYFSSSRKTSYRTHARTHARTHRTYKPQGTRLTAEKGPRETLPRPLRPSVRLYRGAPAPLPSCSSGMKRWIDRWITKIRTQRSKRSYRTLSSLQFSTASTAAIVFYHELDSTSLRHHRQRTARTNDQSVQDARYNQLATKI